MWGNPLMHGRFVNYEQTELGVIRRTANPQPACPNVVWIFGGSTMVGQGAPDDMTVASYLSHELNSGSAKCAKVVNLGADAYDNNQELVLFLELLKSGKQPSMAVFYDGVNEAIVGVREPAGARAFYDETGIRTKLETRSSVLTALRDVLAKTYSVQLTRTILQRLHLQKPPVDEVWAPRTPMQQQQIANDILDNYEANLKMIRALARESGFPVFFFWQPILYYGDKPLDSFESHLLLNDPDDGSYPAVYREAERRAPGQYVFLGHLLDHVNQPLYIDPLHISPDGNRMAAEKIAQAIREAR